MAEIIEYMKTWSVLKWVLLVLIAGFIGQFGRMTAEAIVKKIAARRDKKEKYSAQDASTDGKTPARTENEARQDKLEKKRLKAAAKVAKKAGKKK
jgi:biopolymer transport protein ExbB/TolQ